MTFEVITVACTDRGRHKKRILYAVAEQHGATHWQVSQALFGPGSAEHHRTGRFTGRPIVSAAQYQLKCPFCGRDVQLRRESVNKIFDGLKDTGVSEIDLSYLPC